MAQYLLQPPTVAAAGAAAGARWRQVTTNANWSELCKNCMHSALHTGVLPATFDKRGDQWNHGTGNSQPHCFSRFV
jgi:hypothetical protein